MDVSESLVRTPSASHKYTIILLHGRGRKADIFASEMTSLQNAMPHAKFVFPWAPRQRATVYKKSLTRQWFDDWHLSHDLQSTDVIHAQYDQGLQTSGLGETVAYLHALMAEEAGLVGGAQNVLLGGFSQGAAASLVAALLWNGPQRLGGVVAMCAWLPYTRQMVELLRHINERQLDIVQGGDEDVDEFDPFEATSSNEMEDGRHADGIQVVLEWLQEQIDLPRNKYARSCEDGGHTRILLCHGLNDDKVLSEQSQKASELMSSLGLDSVERKTYPGAGHEITGAMEADIVAFSQLALGGHTVPPMAHQLARRSSFTGW